MANAPSAAAARKAGATVAWTKSVARELAKQGVTLNVVAPGPTDTQLFADFDPGGRLAAALERAIPMGRLGTADEIGPPSSWKGTSA